MKSNHPCDQETSKAEIQEYIAQLAMKNNVSFERGPLDALADFITYYSDDVVEQDDTDNLLVALARADIISGKEMNELMVLYLKAK